MSVLKSLFAYAGRHKYLTILSLLFSFISAVFLLMPFLWIWKVVEEILKVYPDFGQAADAAKYGWYALISAAAGILIYVASLLCSHLAAFRIAANMRKTAMHHVVTLPLGYFSKKEAENCVRSSMNPPLPLRHIWRISCRTVSSL